ncbi:MAG: hypothetical protein ABGX16_02675 [Pirellulales bacterium]
MKNSQLTRQRWDVVEIAEVALVTPDFHQSEVTSCPGVRWSNNRVS